METAREAISGETIAVLNPLQQLDQTRFFVQMGWKVLSIDSSAVPNRRLLRGEITPLRSYQAKENIQAIITGDLIPGSEERDPTGINVLYGKYWRHALHEADRLTSIERGTEYKTGLVEVTTLRDIPQLYDQYDVTQLIYGSAWPNLPERNSDLLELLHTRHQELEGADIPGAIRPILSKVYDELIQAVIAVDRIQIERLQLTNGKMKLSPLDPGAKHAYDPVDREMLIRTGMPEIYSTDMSVARTLELMRERSEQPESPAMAELARAITMLAEQSIKQATAQREILDALQADPKRK